MRLAALALLALMAADMTFAKAKPNKKKDVEPSPIDIYIQDANHHAAGAKDGASGSIWTNDARYSTLAMDLRASRIDDIVTVVVAESASAVSTGATKTQRNSSANASVTSAAGLKSAGGALANLAKAQSNVALDGQGTTSRSTELTTTLSARVTHVLPNGNLVVEGSRNITVNSETQLVTVRGVVRPIDLDTTNMVPSTRLAQMEVRINGKGVVNDAVRRPNFLYRLLLGLLPF